jgi:diacylglycerol kinase family enzyme
MATVAEAPPTLKAVVLLNAEAGTAAREGLRPEELRRQFEEAGLDVEVDAVPTASLRDRARRAAAAGADCVVAAGGDGTVGTVASALVGTRTTLGILPVGTRNHFARDLGLPTDLPAAILTIARGHARVVDVGEVNGRVFVNNASIGLYPEMVEERERRQHLGWRKNVATLWAGVVALRRFRMVHVRLAAAGDSERLKTPFVFVGNNQYAMSLFALGTRACLDDGHLSLYTANVSRRFSLVRIVILALLGRLEQTRDFQQRCVSEAWLDSRWWRLRVALDGEVLSLAPPLHFRARPAALRVMVPETA